MFIVEKILVVLVALLLLFVSVLNGVWLFEVLFKKLLVDLNGLFKLDVEKLFWVNGFWEIWLLVLLFENILLFVDALLFEFKNGFVLFIFNLFLN